MATAALRSTSDQALGVAAHAWRRAFADLPREHSFEPLRVEGRLPEGLRGTLYRTGPSLFGSFGLPYRHWFDGDGAVSAVRFDGGGAQGAVKLVQSAGLLEERRRKRPYYPGYGTPAPGAWRAIVAAWKKDLKNTGNTSVMIWQGRLFAMLEACRPTELRVDDLATLGERDLDGAVLSSFSAHPHYVPARRAAYNFGLRYGRRTELDLYVLPDAGPARRLATVALAGATMIHDFIATERHLIFFAPPLRLNILRQLCGRGTFSENLRWRPEEGTEVLVVPIDEPTAVHRFTVPAFYQWHFAGAFERGDELVVDYVRYADFASNRWLGEISRGPAQSVLGGTLHRARIEPGRARFTDEERAPVRCDFPRVAGAAQANRYVYVTTHSDDEAARGMFDRVARVDVERGAVESVGFGDGQYPSEALFVRRPDGRAEDDGWLLTLVYDAASDSSGVAVLDARELGRGPIARAWFDHHLPFTFHGNFAPAR